MLPNQDLKLTYEHALIQDQAEEKLPAETITERMHANQIPYWASDAENTVGLVQLPGRSKEDRLVVGLMPEMCGLAPDRKKVVLENAVAALHKKHGHHPAEKVGLVNPGSCLLSVSIDPGQEDHHGNQTYSVTTTALGDSEAYLLVVDPQSGEIHQDIPLFSHDQIHHPNIGDESVRLGEVVRKNAAAKLKNHAPPKAALDAQGNYKARLLSNGEVILGVSRAIGDEPFEPFGLSHEPYVQTLPVTISHGKMGVVLLFCDGISDDMTFAKVKDFLQGKLKHDANLAGVAQALAIQAQTDQDSDDCSVILSRLNTKAMTFGIFDGHGGKNVAEGLRQDFLPALREACLAEQAQHQHKPAADPDPGPPNTLLALTSA